MQSSPFMLGRSEALLALALMATTLAIAAPPAAADAHCDAPWGAASSAPLQDDAGSGLDAGDAPQDATLLPGHGEYAAFLDPVKRDGGDAEDWYALDIPADGTDESAIFSVSSDYGPAPYALGTRFLLEVFDPDGVTYETRSDSDPVALTLEKEGTWLMRVTVLDAPQPVYACGTGSPLVRGTGVGGTTSAIAANHIVYFGCDPICSWNAADA